MTVLQPDAPTPVAVLAKLLAPLVTKRRKHWAYVVVTICLDHGEARRQRMRIAHCAFERNLTERESQYAISEVFTLVNTESENHLELFKIWLNLPASDKFVDPYFTMLWDEQIPRRSTINDNGRVVEVTVIAGELDGITPLAPPPNSWAAGSDSAVALWHDVLEPGAAVEVPPARSGVAANRVLYMFDGVTASVEGIAITNDHAEQLRG